MKFRVFRTAKNRSERLTELKTPETIKLTPEMPSYSQIIADDAVKYQTIDGFGAAFTEAAAVTFYKMSQERRKELLKAYFDEKEGIGYNFCRTHINSCDFSLGNYAYDETDGDFDLKNFSIDHDKQALLPLIKEALKLQPEIKLFGSPWSPPAWMKTTGKMNQGGKLRPDCRKAWAEYYCKFIKEYAKEGVAVWGLTVQNEPEASQTWDSCIYTAEEERDFVKEYLGPALHANGLADIKLMVWDHNRSNMYERAKTILSDKEAAKYVWGTGFHWYCGDAFDNVQRVHDLFPDNHLVFTEGCKEKGPHFGEWMLGELYANSIINDLNRWTEAWVDWNIVLDETGGPNHVGNLCSAPVIADTKNDVLNYQNSYYYMGHFSKFIKRGAKRIISSTTRDELQALSVLNPDGSVVIVVLNRSEKDINCYVKFGDDAVKTESLANSIMTFVISK